MLTQKFSRRSVLRAGAAAAIAAPAILRSGSAQAAGRLIKIGFVSPRSGALAQISEGDGFVLNKVLEALGGKIVIGDTTHDVQIIEKDTQSDANRAAELAAELILRDEVDIILAGLTPDTVNPVSDQAEANGVPCVTTGAPWESWYFGRGGEPGKTDFKWTNHFFWGSADLQAVYLELWQSQSTNKVVGALWPNDPDGIAFSDPAFGFPPVLAAQGFSLIDAGRFQNLKDDFSAEIAKFKSAGVEIVTGVMLSPDLATFLVQSKQQGFHPKIVTVAKAALTPTTVESFPDGLGENLSSEVYWGPQFPFHSSISGESAADLVAAYEAQTGSPWQQPIGFSYALLEVGIDALRRATALTPEAIGEAVRSTDLDTMLGHVKWGDLQGFPNVARTPLAIGQWQRDAERPAEHLVVTHNGHFPSVAIDGQFKPKVW
ncbi:MAG: transporter substrate-binding protein [Devosia sp.]|uniref:ABC transporter substrate-binding protein n=1 Tax=Devosia sp. TaxID=1871048 RepID=UPI00260FA14E|nr:ABC transporter substrate-binding protein [Devosia sp.]MDB5526988.1 transporter substrate-binding protein [Devosia sp.]